MAGADSQSLNTLFAPDKPRLTEPFANAVAPSGQPTLSVPKGKVPGKVNRAQQALKGLVGAK